MREGLSNGNWKDGISRIKDAEEILSLPKTRQNWLKKEFNRLIRKRGSSCWEWVGDTFKKNGRARFRGLTAARVSHVLYVGSLRGLNALHTCDNPLCVNPNHLWLGTNADNSADMVSKMRQAIGDRNGSRLYPERLVRGEAHLNHRYPERVQGENNGRATLTNDQVREIKRRYRPYINCRKPSNRRELAIEFGTSPGIISNIMKGKTWRSVHA